MKSIISFFSLVIIAVSCSENKTTGIDTSTADTTASAGTNTIADSASVQDLLTGYFDIKNALADDNSAKAADVGKKIMSQLQLMNGALMTTEQKTVYTDVQGSMYEHAKHITSNPEKIDHQREHFDLLSADMQDLIKVFPSQQVIYVDHCPMYNDKKGAYWLSEVKEIRNPYYGKEMLECGIVKEEIIGK